MHTQDKWFITVGILFMVFFVWVSNAKAESRDLSCKVSTSTEETPKQFKDSGVTRVLKDGSVQKFDGDKFKIVPRTQKRKVCPPTVVVQERIVKEEVIKIERKRNHLQLYVGNGPSDSLSTSRNGNTITVQSEDENLLGLGYSRDIIDLNEDISLSVGGFYFTNETVGVSVGVSW